jgi:FkbM family methyltransferase
MANKLATWIRDARRRRFADAHSQAHGDSYTAYDMQVTIPATVDANVRYLLAKGRPYEAEEAQFIQSTLTPGTAVIELGGSLGVISRVIRRAIGPGATHIVVEANPDLATVCAANAGAGASAGALHMHQAAIAYTDAATVRFDRGDTAHTGQLAAAGASDTFDARAIRLSALVNDLPDGPYALVSDIEGGEYPMFLQEPAETFARLSHAIIEIHPDTFRSMGGSEAAFFEAAERKGLTLLERRADVVLMQGPAA